MRQWWTARSPSERRLLLTGALIVCATLYYVLLLEPMLQARKRQLTQLSAAQALHATLDDYAAQATELRASSDSRQRFDSDASLLSVVNATAAQAGTRELTRRINPLGPRAVSLFIDDVPFADLARWLTTLDRAHGVEVERAVLDATRPGLVDAQVTLRARGAD